MEFSSNFIKKGSSSVLSGQEGMQDLILDTLLAQTSTSGGFDQKLIVILIWQDILEKFEYFPIKCRVQRAFEIFKARQERSASDSEPCFKTKVHKLEGSECFCS